MDQVKRELTENVQSNHSKYSVYGWEMVRIVDRIDTEKLWIKKPRGPLGSCITVSDEKWIHLVEFILGSRLCSFAVDNEEDRKRLEIIIDVVFKQFPNSHSLKPNISCMSFGETKIDIPSRGPNYGFPTVLNVLDITGGDYVVFNWLVDLAEVERILLFENYIEACTFMESKSDKTRTIVRGYSLDKYRIDMYPIFKVLSVKVKSARFLKVTEDRLAI